MNGGATLTGDRLETATDAPGRRPDRALSYEDKPRHQGRLRGGGDPRRGSAHCQRRLSALATTSTVPSSCA